MGNIEYNSGSLRQEFEEQFKEVCSNELNIFYKLIEITGKVNCFLSKISNNDIDSKEYYSRIINARIRDHMTCATLLIGKGFLVDGITLVRSSLEDLWLIQNIYYDNSCFKKWKNGADISPSKLRSLKQISDRKKDNKNIYSALCDISHCNIRSLEHMSMLHPSIKNSNSEGIIRIAKDFDLVIVAFYGCYLQLLELFEDIYENNHILVQIKEELSNIVIPIIKKIK
ncbi:hypothetical protein Q6375_08290 [Clostridium septicum]|uniref:hypothetical protein n=1 Tax=Clostridium septicum TaxID=1504 RepID=UPI00272DD45B|nr:hypothetical protein [Clostridium septicum]WLF70964.1 hypothetical protein Q6375_08290 [Clostridium septicum]